MSRRPVRKPIPRWLMIPLLAGCTLALLAWLPQFIPSEVAPVTLEAEISEPTPEPTPTPTPGPTPEPTPAPPPDYSQPVPEGEAVEPDDWFSDAVFIGDSRTAGFQLYSGVTGKARFLTYTGLTTIGAAGGAQVIRSGDGKISVLDALSRQACGKVYISLGLNELGSNAQGFSDHYAQLIDAVRERQPDAVIYIQPIFPVNEAKCKEHGVASSVNNTAILSYNEALSALCGEKEVWYTGIPAGLQTEEGEAPYDLTADGVHYGEEGAQLWLSYLTTHTGQ